MSPKKYSLNTEGGQAILLNGSDFGSLNETLITAIYNNDLTNVSYTASGCVVTKSDIQIRCYTVPGMGKNYSWTPKIVDQEGVPSLDSVSYSPLSFQALLYWVMAICLLCPPMASLN